VPPSVDRSVGEGGQPPARVSPNDEVVEVSLNVSSSILIKSKHDDDAGVLGHKKLRGPFSLRAMRQAARFGLPLWFAGSTFSSDGYLGYCSFYYYCSCSSNSFLCACLGGFYFSCYCDYDVGFFGCHCLYTIVECWFDDHKCSRDVASFFVSFAGSPSTVLASASPSSSSHLSVSLNHIYTSRDINSLWGMGYKLEAVCFVSSFDKNIIRPAKVQNAIDFVKVFLQRSLAILEENDTMKL